MNSIFSHTFLFTKSLPALRRLVLLAAGYFAGWSHAAEQAPKIWLNHFQLGTLADAPDSDWAVTRDGLDTAFFAINTLWPLEKPMSLSIPPKKAAAVAEKLRRNGIRIGVECGYFDHSAVLADPENSASDVLPTREFPQLVPGVGERTARIEIAKLRTLWQAGHPPDFLILDDPMRRLTVPGQDSPGQIIPGIGNDPAAAREVAAYMKVMREKFPSVKFVIILNFPNWGWKGEPAFHVLAGRNDPMNWGDAHQAMETFFTALEEAGLTIHALQGDFPWRYFAEQPSDALAATVDWPGRILALEAYAREKKVGFHLTANSETGYVSARAFSGDSLKYLDSYLAAGGKPDRFVVQSWYPHPVDLLPESTRYTGTWLAARFIERLREIQNGSPVAAGLRETRQFDRSEPEALLDLLELLNPDLWKTMKPEVSETWLSLKHDPPASHAGGQLKDLRKAVENSSAGKPKFSLLMKDRECRAATGMESPSLTAGVSQTSIVEVVNATQKSTLVTVWQKGSTKVRMEPQWIPPGGFRLFAVDVDPGATVDDGRLTLCVGIQGGESLQVSLPVKIALPAKDPKSAP